MGPSVELQLSNLNRFDRTHSQNIKLQRKGAINHLPTFDFSIIGFNLGRFNILIFDLKLENVKFFCCISEFTSPDLLVFYS